MKILTVLTGFAAISIALLAQADGVSVNPGQWEMTSTITMSMMPQPQTNTVTECIREPELDPEDFNMDENNPCDIADVSVNDDTASWSINCPSQGGRPAMNGKWEFTSSGDSISGSGSMSADFGGQKMNLGMTWTGKRVGDCE